jgi:FAD/FMN-containing dehydrogenase
MDTSTLQRNIRGRIVNRSDPNFQLILGGLLWNQLPPKRYPDVIVQVNDEQDVVQAVKFTSANGLRVAARGGGHSWCGLAGAPGWNAD